jgi:hypothetical protein
MAIYTTLDEVKMILRANKASRVRFYDAGVSEVDIKTLRGSIRDLRDVEPNYDLIVDESKFTISEDFSGDDFVTCVFSDSTNYNVYEIQSGKTSQRLVGSGNIMSAFNPPSGMYEIGIGAFSGTINVGASASFHMFCHVDISTCESFIDHAEVIIDSAIQGAGSKYRDGNNYKMFAQPDVPPEIKIAAAYLSAYLIYTSVFAEEQRDFEVKGSVFLRHFSDAWKKKSESLVDQYIVSTGRKSPLAYNSSMSYSTEAMFCGVNLKWLEPQINPVCGCNDNPIDVCGDC